MIRHLTHSTGLAIGLLASAALIGIGLRTAPPIPRITATTPPTISPLPSPEPVPPFPAY